MSVATPYPTAPGHAARTGAARLDSGRTGDITRPRVPASVLLLGLVTVLVGGWGAAAPFVGPEFGFVANRASAWSWSATSGYLALAPGGLALLSGVLVLGAASKRSFRRRPDLWLLGLLVAAAGAWFVVGQYVWPVIEAKLFIAPSAATHFMWKELAFAIGPGAILLYCGATFMGWSVRRQAPAAVPAPDAPAPDAPAPAAAPAAPVGTAAPAAPAGAHVAAPPSAPPAGSAGTIAAHPNVEEMIRRVPPASGAGPEQSPPQT